jgi:hypothetical protein
VIQKKIDWSLIKVTGVPAKDITDCKPAAEGELFVPNKVAELKSSDE